jgi:membrane protein YdbS with pleckstrin-like domain
MVKSLDEKSYLRTIETVNNDEHVLCVVKQHPFGIIYIYALSLLGITTALILTVILLPTFFGSSAKVYSLFALVALIIIFFAIILMGVATLVYRQSRLTVTDKNVIQIIQKGLFARKVSQISLANVEDVSSEQKGILANIFNFGALKIETAGEQANFNFPFCSNPHRVAHIIIEAKDDFLQRTGQTGSVRNVITRAQEPVTTSTIQTD